MKKHNDISLRTQERRRWEIGLRRWFMRLALFRRGAQRQHLAGISERKVSEAGVIAGDTAWEFGTWTDRVDLYLRAALSRPSSEPLSAGHTTDRASAS